MGRNAREGPCPCDVASAPTHATARTLLLYQALLSTQCLPFGLENTVLLFLQRASGSTPKPTAGAAKELVLN